MEKSDGSGKQQHIQIAVTEQQYMKWTKKNKVKFLEQRPKSQFKIKHRNVAV
jgi:hypothetical protein